MSKKIFISFLFALFLFPFGVGAQATTLPYDGPMPDESSYVLQQISESIETLFTFSAEKKSERQLILAQKRLAIAERLQEQGKIELADKMLEQYEWRLEQSLEKAKQVKEKGKDADELFEKISEATLKHQEVLLRVYENASEQAKSGLEHALTESMKGHERATSAVSKEKREEIEARGQEREQELEEQKQDLRKRGIVIPELDDEDLQEIEDEQESEDIEDEDLENNEQE